MEKPYFREVEIGNIHYFTNSEQEYHRDDDSPAIIHKNGKQEYFKDGKKTRLFGPAVIQANGDVEYWIDDEKISKEKWEKQSQKLLTVQPNTKPFDFELSIQELSSHFNKLCPWTNSSFYSNEEFLCIDTNFSVFKFFLDKDSINISSLDKEYGDLSGLKRGSIGLVNVKKSNYMKLLIKKCVEYEYRYNFDKVLDIELEE